VRDHISHKYKITDKIIVLYIVIQCILESGKWCKSSRGSFECYLKSWAVI